VYHAQNQLDEVRKESFEHARSLFREAADTTAAAFNDEIQKSAQGDLDGFQRALEKVREDARILTETAAEQVHAKSRMETDSCLRDFQNRMATAIEQGVLDAGRQLETQLSPVMDAWRAAAEAHQKRFAEALARVGGELVESYRSRLENVSNAWTLATVTSLDQHSQKLISSVAQSAEDRLREACSNAFAGIGESLRNRLVEMAGGLSALPAPSEEK
jgi:oligoendopeptidase F